MDAELARLNAEVLFWKAETDKRKELLGEHFLDDPCDPTGDSLWQKHAAREVEAARERLSKEPGCAVALVMTLVRDKHALQVCVWFHLCAHSFAKRRTQAQVQARDGTIARLVGLRSALEASHAELEKRLWLSKRRLAVLLRDGL